MYKLLYLLQLFLMWEKQFGEGRTSHVWNNMFKVVNLDGSLQVTQIQSRGIQQNKRRRTIRFPFPRQEYIYLNLFQMIKTTVG